MHMHFRPICRATGSSPFHLFFKGLTFTSETLAAGLATRQNVTLWAIEKRLSIEHEPVGRSRNTCELPGDAQCVSLEPHLQPNVSAAEVSFRERGRAVGEGRSRQRAQQLLQACPALFFQSIFLGRYKNA
jgi:hypothetical protein